MVNTEARRYQAFYTDSIPIVEYMVGKLQLAHDDRIFEPCGGEGAFVDAILGVNPNARLEVFELNSEAATRLKTKFQHVQSVHVKEADTLLDLDLRIDSTFGGIYDKIVANPPYGAWQDYNKRDVLKKIFGKGYTKETYALFLYYAIGLLKEGGILSFIIPDTYLNLHSHSTLRKHILTKTKILELALFPSSFFPGVNFGYANLSIITLQKVDDERMCLDNDFNIITQFSNVKQLLDVENSDLRVLKFKQREILKNPDAAFLISDDAQVANVISCSKLNIGDIADCVTGFYSGDDKTFLKVKNYELKNGKNYTLIEPHKINREYNSLPNILEGIRGEKTFIPIVKGGNVRYLKPEGWYMDWSKDSVQHYRKNKKSRFQNPQHYFRYGVGIPMISSSSITASLIEKKLFDQSIVGVFPKDVNLTLYLLAFFNSPTCNKLIRTINPSANNPSNYIKKIPFINPSESERQVIEEKVREIINSLQNTGDYVKESEFYIHDIIREMYKF